METTIADAEMIVNVARGDILARSGLQPQRRFKIGCAEPFLSAM